MSGDLGTWRCFTFTSRVGEKKFWCIRPIEGGYEVWFGAHGTRGSLRCTPGDEKAMRSITSSKVKEGYVEHERELLGREPSAKKVEATREAMRKQQSPRHFGYDRLVNAVSDHDLRRVKKLFAEGVSPNVRDPDGDFPAFLRAVWQPDTSILAAFLEAGVDPELRHERSRTALMLACRVDAAVAMIDRLVEGGADVAATDERGDTALHVAVMEALDQPDVARALVRHGVPLNTRNREDHTALDVARQLAQRHLQHGPRIVALLEEAGAEGTPADANIARILNVIRSLPKRESGRSDQRMDDLSDAVSKNDLQMARRFLEDGQDPDFPHRPGFYPMEIAKKHGRHEMVELLRSYGAQEREQGFDESVAKRDARVAGFFQDLADLRKRPPPGSADLSNPANSESAIASEIRGGALGKQPGKHRIVTDPVLDYAVESGLTEVALALLDAGAAPGDGLQAREEDRGPSLITRASRDGEHRVVERLLQLGADPNCAQDERMTPLSCAMESGSPALVQLLLDAGADPTWRGPVSQTAINSAKGPERLAKRRLVWAALHTRPPSRGEKALSIRTRKAGNFELPERKGLNGSLDSVAYQSLLVAPVSVAELTNAVAAALPRARVERDVAKRSVVASEGFAFVFRLVGHPESWLACSWPTPDPKALAQLVSPHLEAPLAYGPVRHVAQPQVLTTVEEVSAAFVRAWTSPTKAPFNEVTNGGQTTDLYDGREFLDARGYWLPPLEVRGHGHHYDHGLFAKLVITGVGQADVERVDWVDLSPHAAELRAGTCRTTP